jgi:TRAP-type C4-dicarboxylate transport system substrate-binding protein
MHFRLKIPQKSNFINLSLEFSRLEIRRFWGPVMRYSQLIESAGRVQTPAPRESGRSGFRAKAVLCVLAIITGCGAADAGTPVRLNVVGGLDSVSQYKDFEAPFWREEIAKRSQGTIVATIRPFNRSGLPGSEMLQLLKTGVVTFGTALVSKLAADEPELSALDLPGLNPDITTLRRTAAAFRPFIEMRLRQRYNAKLLGIYTYPAQVLFCAKPLSGLDDLAGRRVRTSSVSQAELMAGLGASPIVISFSDVVPSISRKVVDCAITGTKSGNEIGLSKVTTHVHATAINWGISIFAVNLSVWEGLPEASRKTILEAVSDLEQRIWAGADRETANGLACNIGQATCVGGSRDSMRLVPTMARDHFIRRKMLIETVLPKWLARCGAGCVDIWNTFLATEVGIRIESGGRIVERTPSSRLVAR